jgi:hypothetical protein
MLALTSDSILAPFFLPLRYFRATLKLDSEYRYSQEELQRRLGACELSST